MAKLEATSLVQWSTMLEDIHDANTKARKSPVWPTKPSTSCCERIETLWGAKSKGEALLQRAGCSWVCPLGRHRLYIHITFLKVPTNFC